MLHHKNLMRFLVLGTSALGLSACGFYGQSMPSGYTYHHEEYKSPAPAPSTKITLDQRKYMDATQAEQFRSAVYDLLERLTMRAGMPPKPVYISAPNPMTTFYANLDNDLRESMRHIGYALSDTPDNAYVFTYEAQALTDAQGNNALQNGNNIMIALRVFDLYSENARQLTEETGQYFIQGAELLKMGPANQSFLKPTGKQIFNKMTATPKKMIAPKAQTSITQPMPKAMAVQPTLRAPEPMVKSKMVAPTPAAPATSSAVTPVTAPIARVESAPVSVTPVVKMDEQRAPRDVSRNTQAGSVSSSMTSYTDKNASRKAIKIINRETVSAPASVPAVTREAVTMPSVQSDNNLPSLEEIEAEIQKLDAEISKTTAKINNVPTMAEDAIKPRISKPVN